MFLLPFSEFGNCCLPKIYFLKFETLPYLSVNQTLCALLRPIFVL